MMTHVCSGWKAGRRRGVLLLAVMSMVVACIGAQCADYKLAVRLAQPVNNVAPNTEALGDPVNFTLATGTDIIAAGVGLLDAQPGTINVEVPTGVAVVQVILYWEGQALTETEQGDTDEILLNGTLPVEGVRVGGPTGFLSDFWTSTYRADITGLNLVDVGSNSFTVEGLDFGQRNNGAGVLVLVDDGVNTTDLQIKDGNDFFFRDFAPTLDTTEPVKFFFAPSSEWRVARFSLFFSSAALEAEADGRPSMIKIWIGGILRVVLVDQLVNSDGNEWDTLSRLLSIPPGSDSLEVQALSEDATTGPFAGNLPVSSCWVAAAFNILPPEEGDEGCTPGYWKQSQHFGNWTDPYDPSDLFADHFDDAFPGKTLLQVLEQGGGGLYALGRHTVAALLNSASPDVDFGLTPQEVIDAFNAVYPGGDYEALKCELEDLNERYCPLGRAEEENDNFNGDAGGKRNK